MNYVEQMEKSGLEVVILLDSKESVDYIYEEVERAICGTGFAQLLFSAALVAGASKLIIGNKEINELALRNGDTKYLCENDWTMVLHEGSIFLLK